jgi:hypothetical protein
MPNFIPRSDDQCLAWSANYVRRISANPARFGVSDDDASLLALLQADFAEKLYLAKGPFTGTAATIAAKNAARSKMEQVARRAASAERAMMMNDRIAMIERGNQIRHRSIHSIAA